MSGVEYNVTVEFDAELSRPIIAELIDALEGHGPVVSALPGGHTAVVLTVDEDSVRIATNVALEAVQRIVGVLPAVGVETVPTAVFDAR